MLIIIFGEMASIDSMTKDLTVGQDRPSWPLASYGPAKYVPTVLGGLDESQEELRVKTVAALKAGNIQEYVCPPLQSLADHLRLDLAEIRNGQDCGG